MVDAVGRIAAIKPHPKRRKHYSILVDGHEAIVVHEDVVVALRLQVGAEVTDEALTRISHEQSVAAARDAALRLLSSRPRSRHELRNALTRKAFAAEVAEDALAKLENLGLVNDELFARDLARSLLRRHMYGRQGLLYRLRQSGVGSEVAEEAVTEALEGADETQRALAALDKRLARWEGLPMRKRRAKAYQLLRRLGFDGDVIADALNTALADE